MHDKFIPSEGIDQQFGAYKIIHRKETDKDKVCYFAAYTSFSDHPDYVYYYLEKLAAAGLAIIFISSGPVSPSSYDKLSEPCSIIIEKENKGVDFGAWRVALAMTGYGAGFSGILLANDSVIGPFTSLEPIIRQCTTASHDFYGLTRSLQREEHLQSFFLYFTNKVTTSQSWKEYWESLLLYVAKEEIVYNYEIRLTRELLVAGFKYEVWSDWEKLPTDLIKKKILKTGVLFNTWNDLLQSPTAVFNNFLNPCSICWYELITLLKFPFIKRELIVNPGLNIGNHVLHLWKAPLMSAGYNFDHITQVKSLTEIKHILKRRPLNTASYAFHYFHDPHSPLFSNFFILFPQSTLLKEGGPSYLTLFQKETGIEYLLYFHSLTEKTIDEIIDNSGNYPPVTVKRNVFNILLVYSSEVIPYLSSLQWEQTAFFGHTENYEANILNFIIQLSNYPEKLINSTPLPVIGNTIDISDLRAAPSAATPYNFFDILSEYHEKYETLPMWYKKTGQVFKILSGHKLLTIKIKKKGLHLSLRHKKVVDENNRQEYVRNWYYHEYDVLPGWYKRLGQFIRNKTK